MIYSVSTIDGRDVARKYICAFYTKRRRVFYLICAIFCNKIIIVLYTLFSLFSNMEVIVITDYGDFECIIGRELVLHGCKVEVEYG